jgi:hypothetical protein
MYMGFLLHGGAQGAAAIAFYSQQIHMYLLRETISDKENFF